MTLISAVFTVFFAKKLCVVVYLLVDVASISVPVPTSVYLQVPSTSTVSQFVRLQISCWPVSLFFYLFLLRLYYTVDLVFKEQPPNK